MNQDKNRNRRRGDFLFLSFEKITAGIIQIRIEKIIEIRDVRQKGNRR